MAYGVSALCLSVDGDVALMEAPGIAEPVPVPVKELTAAAGSGIGELPGTWFGCSLGKTADGAWHLFAFRRIPGDLDGGEDCGCGLGAERCAAAEDGDLGG